MAGCCGVVCFQVSHTLDHYSFLTSPNVVGAESLGDNSTNTYLQASDLNHNDLVHVGHHHLSRWLMEMSRGAGCRCRSLSHAYIRGPVPKGTVCIHIYAMSESRKV